MATHDTSEAPPSGGVVPWRTVRQALFRPYPVTLPMVLLVLLVPFYLGLADRARTSGPHAPALALDHLFPLTPAWAPVYGALYLFLILLPVFVIQQQDAIRRTFWAYIAVWTFSYACFAAYPTVAPRPDFVPGEGFAAWGLRFLYDADPAYNCFPSLHVAHSFLSAFASSRVHRGLGRFAVSSAALVAISTVYTKQHYVADAVAGTLLAAAAYAVFFRTHRRGDVPELHRRVAPYLALCVGGVVLAVTTGFWIAWLYTGRT